MSVATRAANAALDALLGALDGGRFLIFAGRRPASPDDPVRDQVLLAELVFGAPAFAPAASGVARAKAIKPEDSALATATATFFRCVTRYGVTTIEGAVGDELELDSALIQVGAKVSVTSFTFGVVR